MAANDKDLMPPATPKLPKPPPTPELMAPQAVTASTSASPTVAPQDRGNPASVDLMASNQPQAVTAQVTDQETTSGQLRDLLSKDSPYMQQARASATKFAASRGLQNSTMAAQAGEQAAISQALPIATQDAATFERQAQANQEAENQFGIQRAGFEQNQALSAQQNLQQLAQMAEAGDIQAQQLLQQHGYTLEEIKAQTAGQSQLQSEKHAQTLIEMAKQGDIESQLQLEKFGFDSKLSAQENVEKLQQMATQGDIDAQAKLSEFNYQTLLAKQQQGYSLQLNDAQLQSQLQVLAKQYANSLGLNEQDTQLWIEKQNLTHQQTLGEIKAQAEANASANSSIDAARATQALQSQYLAEVAQRQALASKEIMTIYQQQGLTSSQQSNAAATARNRLQADIGALQSYYSESPLWDPTWGSEPAPSTAPTSPSSAPTTTPSQSGSPLSNAYYNANAEAEIRQWMEQHPGVYP